MGRAISLLFHDRCSRRGWVVSSTTRPHFTPGRNPVPILQEAGWAPGPAWTDGNSRPHRDSLPNPPACIQSLYRLSYRAHTQRRYLAQKFIKFFYILWRKCHKTVSFGWKNYTLPIKSDKRVAVLPISFIWSRITFRLRFQRTLVETCLICCPHCMPGAPTCYSFSFWFIHAPAGIMKEPVR
jgi:hypothetical protein